MLETSKLYVKIACNVLVIAILILVVNEKEM